MAEEQQNLLQPLREDATCALFVDHLNVDMRASSCRINFGQQTRPGQVVPIVAISMTVADIANFAATLQLVVKHYQEAAANASRIITPSH